MHLRGVDGERPRRTGAGPGSPGGGGGNPGGSAAAVPSPARRPSHFLRPCGGPGRRHFTAGDHGPGHLPIRAPGIRLSLARQDFLKSCSGGRGELVGGFLRTRADHSAHAGERHEG